MPWTSSSAVARRCQSEGLNKGTTPCLAMAQSPTGGWPFSLHDTYIYIYIDIDILYIYHYICIYLSLSPYLYISISISIYSIIQYLHLHQYKSTCFSADPEWLPIKFLHLPVFILFEFPKSRILTVLALDTCRLMGRARSKAASRHPSKICSTSASWQ